MQIQRKNAALLTAILLVAAILRAPITAVGPLTGVIREELRVSNAVMGLLTTIPLLMFAVIAPVAGSVGVRCGIGRVVGLSLIGIFAGLVIRSYTGAAGLFLGTMCVGAGMTFGNVLIPSVIKSELSDRAGLCTSLFSVTMSVFSAISAGISIPLCVSAGLGWRNTLAVWGLLALAALLMWTPHWRLTLRVAPERTREPRRSVWREPAAWWLAGFMAAQSVIFYFFVAWLPSIAQANGVSEARAGVMATVYQLASILGTLVAPNVASRAGARKPVIRIVAALYTLGILLFLFARGGAATWIAAVICGACTGACFSLVLLLLAIRAADPGRSAKLSGMVQAAGYAAAAISPTLAGYLFDLTGTWRVPLALPLALTCFMLLSSGKLGAEETI